MCDPQGCRSQPIRQGCQALEHGRVGVEQAVPISCLQPLDQDFSDASSGARAGNSAVFVHHPARP